MAGWCAMTRTLLAVDGNSLLHRSFHASARTGFHTADGRPMWAVRGLLSQLSAAVDRVCADAVVVGFDDPAASVRRDRWPTYKGHRDTKPATLEDQLDAAVEVLGDLGVVVVVPTGLEADDVLASAAAYAPTVGARTVVATSDRDSFALIDEHTKMLRILNGGVDASPLLDPHRLFMVTGVRPDQYLDFAALRGDASDNLPGVSGIGPKTAARLLAEFQTAQAAFDDAAGDGARCRAVLGAGVTSRLATPEARATWALNCQVMAMVDSAPLGLDLAAGVGCLPLDETDVRQTFARLELHVPSAIRALTGREPSTPRPVDVDASWRPSTRRTTMRHPRLAVPRQPHPTSVQETLF
jgi:DNA polymerase-1